MKRRSREAFTLVELIVVLGVIGLLTTILLPSLGGIFSGTRLTFAGQAVSGQLALARQDALTRNQPIAVRFFQDAGGVCGIGTYFRDDSGTLNPLRRVAWLSDSIRLLATRTTQSTDPGTTLNTAPFSSTGTTTLPARGTVSYFEFTFRPDGSLGTTYFTTTVPTLTLINRGAQGDPPNNFCTVLINPVTGHAESFRP